MVWGVDDTTVLGLAGIISSVLIAAFGYWYNYATRSQPYQQFLYQKQMEAYKEISSELSKLLRPCYEYLKPIYGRRDKKYGEFHEIAFKASLEVDRLLRESGIPKERFPREVSAAVEELTSLLRNEARLDEEGFSGCTLIQDAMTKIILVDGPP